MIFKLKTSAADLKIVKADYSQPSALFMCFWSGFCKIYMSFPKNVLDYFENIFSTSWK